MLLPLSAGRGAAGGGGGAVGLRQEVGQGEQQRAQAHHPDTPAWRHHGNTAFQAGLWIRLRVDPDTGGKI